MGEWVQKPSVGQYLTSQWFYYEHEGSVPQLGFDLPLDLEAAIMRKGQEAQADYIAYLEHLLEAK